MAAIAAIFLSNKANAMTSQAEQDTSNAPSEADNNADNAPDVLTENADMSNNTDSKIAAFLYMIRCCEHVYPRDTDNDACYNIFYGGATFKDMSDHPVITHEKSGIVLPDAVCAASGLGPGCVSTAAGAYQIIKPTWIHLREMDPRLPDFSVQSQDDAAVRLLDENGIIDLINADDIQGAIKKASSIWASLPGSKAQQNPKQLSFALTRYNEGLNSL